MRLSIIIPTYNTATDDIFCLLSSIRIQLAIDWNQIEVIIVNDGGDPVNESLFQLFAPLRIKQINLKINGGPGIARQTGIDAAHGEYLFFCDADDVLYNVGALSAILCDLDANNNPDILSTKWIEEIKNDDAQMSYIIHDYDWTWMHGKVIRAEFAKTNSVRHHPNLRIHEDSYYLNCLAAHCPKTAESNTISYVWRWHDDSITRRNNSAYAYESIPAFLHAVGLADAEIEKFNPHLMPERIVYRIYYTYHLTHSNVVTEHTDARAKAEETFIHEVTPYMHYWNNSTEKMRYDMCEETVKYAAGAVLNETLDEWLNRLQLSAVIAKVT